MHAESPPLSFSAWQTSKILAKQPESFSSHKHSNIVDLRCQDRPSSRLLQCEGNKQKQAWQDVDVEQPAADDRDTQLERSVQARLMRMRRHRTATHSESQYETDQVADGKRTRHWCDERLENHMLCVMHHSMQCETSFCSCTTMYEF